MAKSRFAIEFEYLALRGACAVVNAVPYPVATALARFVGFLATDVLRLKRRRTFDRIESVFPGISVREKRRIARMSFANILLNAVELMRAPRLDRAWMDRRFIDGPRFADLIRELSAEGHGVVIMVPHSGNWYMAAWAMAKYGVKLAAIAARQRNPKLDAWMNRQYGDIEVLDRDCRDTLGRIKDKLHAGRAFAILPDLRVRRRDTEVDFFGGKANVSHAGAMFAVHAGAPIVAAVMRRVEGKHFVDFIGVLRPDPAATDPKAEAMRLTREVMARMDEKLRAHPEDWFWYNKRWILEPPER